MALQNFYMTGTNYKRTTPVTLSGKEMKIDLFMKVKGSSKEVVKIYCFEDEGNSIKFNIVVKNPETGEIEFDSDFWCEKK